MSDKTIIKALSSAFGILFLLVGVIMIIVSAWVNLRTLGNRRVSAAVSEVIETRTQTRKDYENVMYTLVYEYYDGGEVRTYKSLISTSMPAAVGDEATLYISENGVIYEKTGTLRTLFMGILFAALGVFLAFIKVKKIDETER